MSKITDKIRGKNATPLEKGVRMVLGLTLVTGIAQRYVFAFFNSKQ